MPRCARCFSELNALAVFCSSCQQPHQPDFEHLRNQVIGDRYQIYRRLSQGGLSTVFSAIDVQTDEIVVVKISDPSHLTRRELTYALAAQEARQYWAEMLERMRREAEALLEIRHPHIVQLYGTGTLTDDLRYVVMEFLRGQTLREELAARGKLPLPEALTIASALAEALRAIHSRGIVHRDLNPRNVMLCPPEASAETGAETSAENNKAVAIKLIDFGIAKFPQPPGAPPFTQHSILSGTVAYASPEQCQNQPLDQRADLYSLAVVLYEMVTGERPFTGRTPTEIALKQIQETPRAPRSIAPELPLSLEKTLLRALAKAPDARQANIVEFSDELRAIAQRVVVALPKKVSGSLPATFVTEPLPPPTAPLPALAISPAAVAESAAEPEPATAETVTAAPALFTAYQTPRASRGKKLAYAAALLTLLGGGLFAYERWQGQPLLPRVPQLAQLFATPTPAPLAPLEASFNNLPTPTPAPAAVEATPELDLAAPEAQMAGAGESFPLFTASNAASNAASRLAANKGNAPKANRALAPAVFKASARANAHETAPELVPPSPLNVFNTPAALPTPDLPALDAATPDVAIGPPLRRRAGRELPSADLSGLGSRPRPRPSTTDSAQANEEADAAGEPDESATTERARRDFAPRVIAWSGAVSGERIVRLEMPGVPGSVEIPRSYRRRVGIIEPPSNENQWRLVALRVYGRGEVSLVLRWWPK